MPSFGQVSISYEQGTELCNTNMSVQGPLFCSQNRDVALDTLNDVSYMVSFPSSPSFLFPLPQFLALQAKWTYPFACFFSYFFLLSLLPLTSFIYFHLPGFKFLVHTPASISASALFLIMYPLHIELQLSL